MSRALAKAAPLKSEIRLANAISEFKTALPTEQKMLLESQTAKAQTSPPDVRDVMRLTAEIDRSTRSGRCLGPRFTSFLQVLQLFAAAGDVVVGGSQNLIACGVWSVVRMSLIALTNFSSCLEKLSALLMAASRSAPRYQAMGALYAESSNLQSFVNEYLIVVVRVCHCFWKISQQSRIKQLTGSWNDSELQSFQAQLSQWGEMIKEELSLLLAHNIAKETRQSSRSRARFVKHSEAILIRQQIEVRNRLLDACTTYDYQTAWKRARKMGKSTIVREAPDYQKWKNLKASGKLLVSGKLGSGKSVLLANIVDDLYVCAEADKSAVAYFFCRYDEPESLRARTIIGSLARQLISVADTMKGRRSYDEQQVDMENIPALLHRAFGATQMAYFVLDGLDECSFAERELTLQTLHELQNAIPLLLCLSYRKGPGNFAKVHSNYFTAAETVSMPENNSDIDLFIQAELERCIESTELNLGDPTLVLDIQDALSQQSQGMFLWVVLQMQTLCSMESDAAIRRALKELPKDLPDTFARILRSAAGSTSYCQKRILQLIAIAHRALTVEDFRGALSVTVGETTWNASKLLNDVLSTLKCCGGLILVDEEDLTVRFVHHSVKQFVLSQAAGMEDLSFTLQHANTTMLGIIATYLNYGVFDTRLAKASKSQPGTANLLSTVIDSTFGPLQVRRNIALRLLRARRQPKYDIGRALADVKENAHSSTDTHFSFYTYATSHYSQHVYNAAHLDATVRALMWTVPESIALVVKNPPSYRLTLLEAAGRGFQGTVQVRLYCEKSDPNATDEAGRSPLWLAARNGYEEVLQLLLDIDGVNANLKDNEGCTALVAAIRMGHRSIVQSLLSFDGVDIDTDEQDGYILLQEAIKSKDQPIMQLLMKCDRVPAYTRLCVAALLGQLQDVRELLYSGRVNLNQRGDGGCTPLCLAVREEHHDVVELLLESSNVDVNVGDENGVTPLMHAAALPHGDILLKVLHYPRADPNTRDQDGQTALHSAVNEGRLATVELLLGHEGIDPSIKDTGGETPLDTAVRLRKDQIAELLRTHTALGSAPSLDRIKATDSTTVARKFR